MSCDFDHDGPVETCACSCACDAVIHWQGDGICFACWHGEHQTDVDLYYPDDED